MLGNLIGSVSDLKSVQYREYICHQKEKTKDKKRRKKWLVTDWTKMLDTFFLHFATNLKYIDSSKRCLCVAARCGHEVKALQDLGFRAIGVDLVPCEPLVMKGDMHSMPFGDSEFGFVFTNSYDHARYPNLLCSEILRVLSIGGVAMFLLPLGMKAHAYDVTEIHSSNELISRLPGVDLLEDVAIPSKPYNWMVVVRKQ